MIIVENIGVYNAEFAIKGMRNPLESWDQSDSYYNEKGDYIIGENDMKLALKLIKAGSDHRKFIRQIFVSMDITAPLYWWKEMDQYRIGSTTNSTSTMHTIHKTPIVPNLFSVENLNGFYRKINNYPNIINEETEEWKQHPKHSLYLISNQGRIKRKPYITTHNRLWKEKILKNIAHNDGYLVVDILQDNKKRTIVLVHRLVAETFISNENNLPEVNHKDGNKQNNYYKNLEWSTRNENEQHSYDIIKTSHHNLNSRKKHSNNLLKLNKEQRELIKIEYSKGESSRQLGKKYNVDHTVILDIIHDKTGNIQLNEYDSFVIYCNILENLRLKFLETNDKKYWIQLIQMLPSSFNQRRTWSSTYETLKNIYHARKNHRLDEWKNFCNVLEQLPYSEFITVK